jgi:catechol 2,3-dioxygenase-like lactoylglutathione lyase family enzyme
MSEPVPIDREEVDQARAQRLITHLRHVDLAVPDFATQRNFYTDLWGLTEVASEAGLSYLAAEGSAEPYIVRVRDSAEKRIDLIAFGAANSADVDALAERLASNDVQLISEPAPLETYAGGYGFRFFDNEGRTVEVSSGVETRTARTIEAKESIPVSLSHVVLNSATPQDTVAWYLRNLHVALSDQLVFPDGSDLMWFLRCNPLHHSLAIVAAPHAALHHLSFEMRGIEENLFGTGRLLRAGVERIWGPGKHLAGDNMYNYFLDPSGNTMEYTTNLEIVDEATWEPGIHNIANPNVADQWGTANAFGPDLAIKSHNDVDKGLFQAPPV